MGQLLNTALQTKFLIKKTLFYGHTVNIIRMQDKQVLIAMTKTLYVLYILDEVTKRISITHWYHPLKTPHFGRVLDKVTKRMLTIHWYHPLMTLYFGRTLVIVARYKVNIY